eukprot:466148_1
MTTTSKESAFLKKIKRKSSLLAIQYALPFAAATPDMNDTQSTTNNSLRDPNNNGIAAPMDIDQDDDTDDEDQCMSNDIPIEQQNRCVYNGQLSTWNWIERCISSAVHKTTSATANPTENKH